MNVALHASWAFQPKRPVSVSEKLDTDEPAGMAPEWGIVSRRAREDST